MSAERIDAENKISNNLKISLFMRKNMIKAAFVAAVGLIAGVNVYNSRKSVELSDIALANVEALADDESSVTCNSDKGDVCVVGSTNVSDYDEGCSSWFWG